MLLVLLVLLLDELPLPAPAPLPPSPLSPSTTAVPPHDPSAIAAIPQAENHRAHVMTRAYYTAPLGALGRRFRICVTDATVAASIW
jgi:hypothetical protein